jgi:hypothetical protein
MIELDSSAVGTFAGQITLQPQSTNPRPFSMNLDPVTIHVVGEVRLRGDYNKNGIVDAADYIVWRKSFGNPITLANETASIGIVDGEDYDAWRANFGAAASSGASTVADNSSNISVPEPQSGMLLLGGIVGLSLIFDIELQLTRRWVARRLSGI